MARGKHTCRILKEIRRQIARANDIEFVTSECSYRGDCPGTCPKCEAEVRYLEQQLRARTLTGKAVALAGISAGMILMSGCNGTSATRPTETLQGEPADTVVQVETIGTDSVAEPPEEPTVKDTVETEPQSRVSDLLIVGEIDEKAEAGPDSITINNNYPDTFPSFPDGNEKLQDWLVQHVVYPQEAIVEGAQGRVVVEVMIQADGTPTNAKIVRPRHPALNAEALRVAEMLPKFNPATHDGEAVNYYFAFPITFRLPTDTICHEENRPAEY